MMMFYNKCLTKRWFDGSALLSLEFLDLEAWGQGLLQLLGLLLIFDDKCVQEARASDLEEKTDYTINFVDLHQP